MRRHGAYEKIMTAIVAIVIITIVGFIGRAALSPSVSYNNSVEISASPSDVWPYLVDENKRTLWQTGVRTVANLMGGEMMMGVRSVIVKKVGAKQWEIEEEVVNYIEGEIIAVVHSSDHYVENIVMSLEQKNGAVVVNYNSHKMYSDFVKNIFAPWYAYREKQALSSALATLKGRVEESVR